MKITITRSCMIQPAQPTFNGPMPLSESDQTGELTHIPIFYFYPNPSLPHHIIFSTLQTSLAKALVHFYPLAGRLRWLPGSRLELDCNSSGAQLFEAKSDATLDDLGGFTPSPNLHPLIPHFNYSSTPIEEIPLLTAQLTKFRCGGVVFGFSASHAIVDGQSANHFLSEWARLARGEPLSAQPVLDRRLLRAGEPPSSAAAPRFEHPQFGIPPLLLGQSSTEEEREKETEVAMLKLSKMQVETLKRVANGNGNGVRVCEGSTTTARGYTRYEAVAAHIWRCACVARGHAPEQPASLGVCVDVRGRVRPPLPEKYFGNAVVDVIVRERAGEVVARPLGYSAGKIREAVEEVTSDYVHSTIDYLKKVDDFSSFQDVHASEQFYGNPHISVTSWARLPLVSVDFGWGKEVAVVPATHGCDGDSFVMPSCDGDGDGGLVIVLCLQKVCMDDFKKYFYQQM